MGQIVGKISFEPVIPPDLGALPTSNCRLSIGAATECDQKFVDPTSYSRYTPIIREAQQQRTAVLVLRLIWDAETQDTAAVQLLR